MGSLSSVCRGGGSTTHKAVIVEPEETAIVRRRLNKTCFRGVQTQEQKWVERVLSVCQYIVKGRYTISSSFYLSLDR